MTKYSVGDKVKEINYGFVGTVASIRTDAHVVWYVVRFDEVVNRGVFADCLACELEAA